MTTPKTYSVIVGNLGTVHSGHNRRVALREYRDWLRQVNADYRAHGQSVTCCENGEPLIETGAYAFEQTDTFSGEANYSWVKRGIVQAENLAHAGRIVRAELYAKGTRFNVDSYGDTLDIRPRGICHVVFVSWCEGDKA
jgi:hypothetical protein